MKTGALLTCACRMGAIAAGAEGDRAGSASPPSAEHLGLAFQIVDDLLDVTSTPEQLGKATDKDAGKGKNTYPALMGLKESRIEASKAMDTALEAIEPLGERACFSPGHRSVRGGSQALIRSDQHEMPDATCHLCGGWGAFGI